MNTHLNKVMVIDDEPFMLKLLGRMLENQGLASVMLCDSGRAALGLMDGMETKPNLILLDLNMPEMDGIEFLRHLAEQRFTGSLILISGEDDRTRQSAERLAKAHKITVLGHLQKPALPEDMAAMLAKWQPYLQDCERAPKKIYTGDEVRAGIANGELVNYYQPKVEVATGLVDGVETLVRWRHPKDGMVFPDQFIGVAEAYGLIDALTRVVFSSALAQAKIWQDAGLMLRVAVNVSMDNLASLDFADFVIEQAAIFGVPADSIVLEVTESRLMKDQRTPIEILTRLRIKRFRLSIDDFGTGNSTLTQLRDMPFDELKIDQSFVHRAWTVETMRVLFDTSLGLAKRLGMESVAEGVEDRADWDFLHSTSCDQAQGYFIARPMPGDDIHDWIIAWEATVGNLMPPAGAN